MKLENHSFKVHYKNPVDVFNALYSGEHGFLYESLSQSERFGRLSILGIDPILELRGKRENVVEVTKLASRGERYFSFLQSSFKDALSLVEAKKLELYLPKKPFSGEESKRPSRNNTAQVIRALLLQFPAKEKSFIGLYGALSYRFISLFEDINISPVAGPTGVATGPTGVEDEVPDFHLFFYDTFVFFNHLTGEANLYLVREDDMAVAASIPQMAEKYLGTINEAGEAAAEEFSLNDVKITPTEDEYREQVEKARELCCLGELMEVVLSRKVEAHYSGSPLSLYMKYRAVNPSPYMFYLDLGDEYLVGASPEMMLRHEQGKIVLRPISGTMPRGKSAIEDYEFMMKLLTSEKEKAELDMLIDLGRNDLSRVCLPGVAVDDYRYVEKYSHVMHTVAQVSGTLSEGRLAFDALVATLNAGTLTGAPKVAAMKHIELMEKHSRGYYGGVVGYFLLSGELDTCIVIRTAHLKNNKLSYLSGATLLYDSVPENELRETKIKSEAFLTAASTSVADLNK